MGIGMGKESPSPWGCAESTEATHLLESFLGHLHLSIHIVLHLVIVIVIVDIVLHRIINTVRWSIPHPTQ